MYKSRLFAGVCVSVGLILNDTKIMETSREKKQSGQSKTSTVFLLEDKSPNTDL